jgi:hypothetical protein
MTITLVGTPQTGSSTNGENVNLTFPPTPSQDDVVVVAVGTSKKLSTFLENYKEVI